MEGWKDTGDRLARVTEELGEPFDIRNIEIVYLKPNWATGEGIFKAECKTCGAYSTMRASERSQLEYLASLIERYECPKKNHHYVPEVKQ